MRKFDPAAHAAKLLEAMSAGSGGSIDLKSGASPNSGYMVARGGSEEIHEGAISPEQLVEYVKKHATHLRKPGHFLGGWFNPKDNKTYLDVSRQIHDEEEAHAYGRRHKQQTLYDFKAANQPGYNSTPIRQFSAKEEAEIEKYRKNFSEVYKHALAHDPDTVDAGHRWYEVHANSIEDWGKRHGFARKQAIGAAAAISPGLTWDQTLPALEALLEHGPQKTNLGAQYGRLNATKAHRILKGEAPEDILGGNKVTAFNHNFLHATDTDPESVSRATVDGHMNNIAHNGMLRLGISQAQKLPRLSNVPYYEKVGEAINRVAQEHGVSHAHKVQAAMWLHYRNLELRKHGDLQEDVPVLREPGADEGEDNLGGLAA